MLIARKTSFCTFDKILIFCFQRIDTRLFHVSLISCFDQILSLTDIAQSSIQVAFFLFFLLSARFQIYVIMITEVNFMRKRTETRPIQVGNLQIGGQNQVIIQSMTNTKTKNVTATVEQIRQLTDAGCQTFVRMAVYDQEDARAHPGNQGSGQRPAGCRYPFRL